MIVYASFTEGRQVFRNSGRWYIHTPPASVGPVTHKVGVREAASVAAAWLVMGGEVRFGQPGGRVFDKWVRHWAQAYRDRSL